MPHISENDVEKMKNLEDKIKWLWQYGVESPTAREYFQAIVDAIQPAPQSDEVREAVEWAKNEIMTSRTKANDCRLPDHIARLSLVYAQLLETLIRAARCAPVDLERVLQPIATCPKDIESRFIQYRERDEYVMVGDYYQSKGYETTHWAPLPTPSKE